MYVLTYILDSPTNRSQLSVLDVPCKRRSERGGGAFPTKLCRIKSAFLAALVRVSWACWDPLIMTWNLYHGIFILEPRDVERKRGRGTRAHCHFRESTRGPETGSCRAGDQRRIRKALNQQAPWQTLIAIFGNQADEKTEKKSRRTRRGLTYLAVLIAPPPSSVKAPSLS